MAGPKTGVWKDFASGEGGDNLLDLLYRVSGVSFADACKEAAEWLGARERYEIDGHTSRSGQYSCWQDGLKPCSFKYLQSGSAEDRSTLAGLLGVSDRGLAQADTDGVLKFFDHPTNGRCWVVADRGSYVRQDRRLDGRPFLLKNDAPVKARTIGSPGWPIGVPTDKRVLAIVEGSSDFLAAYSIICADELEKHVTPVAILGAANTICDEALERFREKYVLVFPDYDRAGVNAAVRWEGQLKDIASAIEIFDYAGMLRDDGKPIKDLRDLLRMDVDQWENYPDIRSPLSDFVSKLKKEGKIYVADKGNDEGTFPLLPGR
jgi:hypothetical protein